MLAFKSENCIAFEPSANGALLALTVQPRNAFKGWPLLQMHAMRPVKYSQKADGHGHPQYRDHRAR